MKKGFFRIVAVVMVVLMTAVYMPVADITDMFAVEASAASYDGGLGGNVRWSYNSSNKTVVVSGSGNMSNYSSTPGDFTKYRAALVAKIYKHATKIEIKDGVTSIGNNVFRDFEKVSQVIIPASVTSIGQSAFEGCSSLSSVSLPSNLKTIGAYAFKNTKFATVKMPDSLTSIGSNAFAGVSGFNVVCNYGTYAFNYCVNNSIPCKFPENKFIVDAKLDAANKQVNVNVKMVYNKADFNAGNFTLSYNSAVSPVSTDTVYKSENGVTTAVVHNSGKASIAVMAQTFVPYSTKIGVCAYDFGTYTFNINGQADKAEFSFTCDALMMNESKTTLSGAAASADLHIFTESVEKEANCKQTGTKVTVCSVCGLRTETDIPVNPANHINGTKTINASPADCGNAGYTGDVVCNDCGAVLTKGTDVPATGAHDYDSVVTGATCTKEGYTTYTCKVCGHTYDGDKTPVKAHDYKTVVTEATCTKEGYTTYTCKVCGHSYEGDKTPVKAHDYEKVVTEATCTKEGHTTYTCKVCGHSYEGDKTPVKAHDYEKVVTEATCKDKGFTTYTCKVCKYSYVDDETPVGDHKYDTVVTEPTCTAGGYTTYTCSACGDSYKGDFTSQLGHDFDANGECTRCDETTVISITFKDNTGISVDNENKVIIIAKTLNVSDVKANIASGEWIVNDSKGNVAEDTKAVTTGSVIKAAKADIAYSVVILGDVNGDGRVNASDARTALRAASKLETLAGLAEIAANCDGKARITAADARLILRVGAKLQTFI